MGTGEPHEIHVRGLEGGRAPQERVPTPEKGKGPGQKKRIGTYRRKNTEAEVKTER